MVDPRLRRHALGFLEVTDRPTAKELGEHYAKAYYQNEHSGFRKSYPQQELDVIALRIDQHRAKIAEIRGHDRPGRLLDVGCGEGFVLKAFSRDGWDVNGLDFSTAGVMGINPEVADRVEQGDIFTLLETWVASGRTCDVIWLGNVLEHVLDPLALLDRLRSLAKPDTVLVVTVPNDGTEYQESLLGNGYVDHRFWIAIPEHLSYFTAESLRMTANARGWDCKGLRGDFPIDVFLSHPGSNYVADRSQGPAAHQARLRLEHLIGQRGTAVANRFYEALAETGLGRDLTAYLMPARKEPAE